MCLHEAGNSRQKEQHAKRAMSRYVVKFIEFLSQKRNRTVLMESTHEEDQTDKHGPNTRKVK